MNRSLLILAASVALAACSNSASDHTTSSLQDSERMNVPANHCELYIREVTAEPNSHSSANLKLTVHVPWLGDGEVIEDVRFYGKVLSEDLGNGDSCHWGPGYHDETNRTYPANGSDYSSYGTDIGDYVFQFPVKSGTVLSQCPGYHYSWIGSFYLQTNKKTYWLNPNMNPGEQYYIDANGYGNIQSWYGSYRGAKTDNDLLSYYNPRSCSR